MSDPQDHLLSGFIHSFKDIVDRVDPHDLVLDLVQRRILPLSHMDRSPCERREERMMRLLGRVYRQSMVDTSTMPDFVSALKNINTTDPGHRYEDVIESFDVNFEVRGDGVKDYLPFNEIERRVFDCTRRVAEKSLELDILPALVSARVVGVEALEDILSQRDRLDQIHCLMEHIQSAGSLAFNKLVDTLLESEDRSALSVGTIMQECLQAQKESPHTPPEWLGMTEATYHNNIYLHECLIFSDHRSVKQDTSPECAAFQHAYCSMFSHISDNDPHLTLVNLLYSSGLFDRSTRDRATDSRQQRVNQIRYLLKELEILIEARSGVYHQLVSVLEQAENSKVTELAVLLQQKYGNGVIKSAWCYLSIAGISNVPHSNVYKTYYGPLECISKPYYLVHMMR